MTPAPSPAPDASSTDAAFEEVLARYDESTAGLARAVRDLVRTLHPAVVEVPWPKQATVGFGVGPRKFTEHYAYLAVHRDHVNLGFNQGAELDDPAHLLSGPGKSLRHHRIDRLEDVRDPALSDLLVHAREHRAATTHPSGRSSA